MTKNNMTINKSSEGRLLFEYQNHFISRFELFHTKIYQLNPLTYSDLFTSRHHTRHKRPFALHFDELFDFFPPKWSFTEVTVHPRVPYLATTRLNETNADYDLSILCIIPAYTKQWRKKLSTGAVKQTDWILPVINCRTFWIIYMEFSYLRRCSNFLCLRASRSKRHEIHFARSIIQFSELFYIKINVIAPIGAITFDRRTRAPLLSEETFTQIK